LGARVQIVFQMRYSYVGQSGWKSAVKADPGLLLAKDRLDHRRYMAEKVAVVSLKAQEDPDFKLVVLSADAMREAERVRMKELFYDNLGEDRVALRFEPPGSASQTLVSITKALYGRRGLRTQVVLDDDDALSTDDVGRLRKEARMAWRIRPSDEDYMFLSFPRGISLVIEDQTAGFTIETFRLPIWS